MKQIPEIIHQTWKSDQIPPSMLAYQASWIEHHAHWRYMLWTDEENRQLIASHYSWFLSTYDAYPFPIQRVDAARYFILHRIGGLYVDLDYECLRNLSPLLRSNTCILGVEPASAAAYYGHEKIVSNALIASIPSHPLLEALLEALPANLSPVAVNDDTYVLESTGPFLLTRVYDSLADKDCVDLLAAELTSPLTMGEADLLRERRAQSGPMDPEARAVQGKLNGAYAVHYHVGTWWRGLQQL